MADRSPDYPLEIIKLKTQAANLTAQMARFEQEYAEIESRKALAVKNWLATKRALEDCEQKLEGMKGHHGDHGVDMNAIAREYEDG